MFSTLHIVIENQWKKLLYLLFFQNQEFRSPVRLWGLTGHSSAKSILDFAEYALYSGLTLHEMDHHHSAWS